MNLLKGKKGLVLGVANRRSIAWYIAQACHAHGAELALTYQDERLLEKIRPLAARIGDPMLLPCDVTDDEQIDAVFERIEQDWGGLDFMVHALAFARRDELEGSFLGTTREGFRIALEVSAFSLTDLTRRAAPLMERNGGGSILTLSYLGGQRVVPNYNVMGVAKAALECSVRYLAYDLGPRGIRVNAMSPGPIRTVAAAGIRGFHKMLEVVRSRSPLRQPTQPQNIADTALYLLGDMSLGMTGEVLFVDGGYHVMGYST